MRVALNLNRTSTAIWGELNRQCHQFFLPFFDSSGGEFIRQPKYFLLARKIFTEKKGGDQNVL